MTRKLLLTIAISVMALVNLFAYDWDNVAVPANAGSGKMWQLQENVSDDFNYTFNAANSKTNFGSNKWYNFYHNSWDGPGTTYWQYNNVAVNSGNLVISVAKSANTSKMNGLKGINSGCVTSNAKVLYPVYVEAAVSVANISLASCFWLLSPDDTQEIDIIENYGNVNWYKQFTHISHHSFVRNPFTDYQPRDWNSWYVDSRVSNTYGWGDWCWNNGTRRYMRMGVYWISPKHFEYYIDGEIVRVMYNNATATKVGATWEYTYFNSTYVDGNGKTHPSNTSAGYTDVTKHSTSTTYDFAKLEAASNASKGISVIDPGWFQGGTTTTIPTGFTKELDIIINVESQEWLATSHTPSDADLANSARNQMKVDWVRVYKPTTSTGNIAVTSVDVAATASLAINEKVTPSYTVYPSNATNKAVTWTSDNTTVATVNQATGEVTGIKAGTANITAKTADGNKTDVCIVTVSAASTGTGLSSPFTLEAENYTRTGGIAAGWDETVAGVKKTTSYINYVNNGDYIEHDVVIAEAGEYNVQFYICSPAATQAPNPMVELILDGTSKFSLSVPNKALDEWNTFTALTSPTKINLTAGSHTIKIKANGGEWVWNLDRTVFSKTLSTNLNFSTTKQISIFPNPTKGVCYIHGAENNIIHIYTLSGVEVLQVVSNNNQAQINTSQLQPGVYIVVIDGTKTKLIVQ